MRPLLALLARWGGLSAALLLGFSLLLRNPMVTAAGPLAQQAAGTPVALAIAPACTVVSLALNLRAGPGLNYNPPLRTLPKGTVLTPLARNAAATWIQVQVREAAETGWVSTAAPYVRCNLALSQLPTPLAPATANPTPPSVPPTPVQSTPTPSTTALATTDRQVTLLAPDNHDSIVGGRWTFRWRPSFTLPPNTAFEVVFWQDNEDPLTQAQGGVPPTAKTEVGIDLDVLDQSRIIQSGLNHWGILLVQPETGSQPYRRLAFLQGDFDFTYSPVPPTPTPTDTPTRTPRP